MSFIKQHWTGKFPLATAFCGWFVLLGITYHVFDSIIFYLLIRHSGAYEIIYPLYVLLTRLMIYPWQAIGLLRAAERNYVAFDSRIILYLVQASLLVSLVATISHVTGVVQVLVYRHNERTENLLSIPESYTIDVIENKRVLRITGILDFGVSAAVEDKLQTMGNIESIVLESTGGQVYEGRGLALLIQKYKLNTYSFKACESACATSFIAGQRRYMGTDARLGFHQYSFDWRRRRLLTPFYDLDAEQRNDMAFYKERGIDSSFVLRVFSTPANTMWYPTAAELISAGVVTAVVHNLP